MPKKIKPETMAMDPKDGSEKDYEAHNAYRTLVEADAHKSNPEMMKRVKKVAEKHMDSASKMMSVNDIKEYSKKKYPPKLRYEKENE
jgi:hypothetical protein